MPRRDGHTPERPKRKHRGHRMHRLTQAQRRARQLGRRKQYATPLRVQHAEVDTAAA